MLEMATGQPPWHTLNLRTPVALINWVKRTEGPPPLPQGLSQPLTKFLLRCFERDPSKRATARELLSDPFVAKRRGERVLLPKKGSAPHSDNADSVVSDIDNLSRTAAIARIRRASVSDYSRPNSDQSTRSAPSPRGSDFGVGVGGGGGVGGSSASGVGGGDAGRGPERSHSPPRDGGGGGYLTDLAQQVVAKLEDVGDGGTPPRRPVSLHSALTPPLRVVTAGLEPTPSSSSAPRVITTPPARRLSMGRNSPGTPNPFGGRRRSLDTSPDGARSSVSPRASGVSLSQGGLLCSAGSQEQSISNVVTGVNGNGSEGLEAAASTPLPLQNADGGGSAATAAAAVAGADRAEEDAPVHVNTKGEGDSNVSLSAAKRSDSGGGGSSSSSSRSRNPRRTSAGSQGGEKTAGGDRPASVAAPVSDNVSPAVHAGIEVMEVPPVRAPAKTRPGRGDRPSGCLSADTESAGSLALE